MTKYDNHTAESPLATMPLKSAPVSRRASLHKPGARGVVLCALAAFAVLPLHAREITVERVDFDADTIPTNTVLSIGPGSEGEVLAVAWGKSDGGTDISGWDYKLYLRRLGASAESCIEIKTSGLITGTWGNDAKELRFFTVTGDTETPPGADAYIGMRNENEKSDIIAAWDGIENAGLGLPHVPDASQWTDISGHGFNWPLNSSGNWTGKSLRLSGYAATLSSTPNPITKIATMELVYLNRQTSGYGIIFMPAYDGTRRVYAYSQPNAVAVYDYYGTGFDQTHTQYVAGVYNKLDQGSFDGQVYSNGVAVTAKRMSDYWNTQGARDSFLGSRSGGGCPAYGELFALRLYNRKLADYEIAYNYMIDSIRFGLAEDKLWVSDPAVTGYSRTINTSSSSLVIRYEYRPLLCGRTICSKETMYGNDEATFEFIPIPGFTFIRWEGLPDEADATANPVTFRPLVSRTIKAVCRGDFRLEADGSDLSDGISAPWATLEHAFAEMTEDSTLTIGEGIFTNSVALELLPGVKITGAGAGKTILMPPSSAVRYRERGFKMTHQDNMIQKVSIRNYNVGDLAAYVNGCGVWMSEGILADSEVSGCQASSRDIRGGGIYLSGGIVTNCVISGNSLYNCSGGRFGGGIYIEGGIVTDCLITGNTTGTWNTGNDNGPGVYMDGGTLRNSVIRGNYGASREVISAAISVNSESANVENCFIEGNTPLGLRIKAGTVTGCVVSTNYNSTGIASGIYLEGGKLYNCTSTGNYSTNSAAGQGLHMKRGTAVNNLICGNGSADTGFSEGTYVEGGLFNTNFTDTAVNCGIGNLFGNPRFRKPDSYDGHILTSSPCINAGATLDWMLPGVKDIYGSPRILGPYPDIGAEERNRGGTLILAK